MAYIYSLADTWNASGTTFTGIGLNVTDSASAAGSLLMDLQVGGVSKFSVTKAGAATVTNRLAFGTNASFYTTSSNEVSFGSADLLPGTGGTFGNLIVVMCLHLDNLY